MLQIQKEIQKEKNEKKIELINTGLSSDNEININILIPNN